MKKIDQIRHGTTYQSPTRKEIEYEVNFKDLGVLVNEMLDFKEDIDNEKCTNENFYYER